MTYTQMCDKLWGITENLTRTLNTLTEDKDIQDECARAASKDIPMAIARIAELSPEDQTRIKEQVILVKRAIQKLGIRAMGY